MDSQLTVRLPDDLRRALDSASRKTGLKSSELVRDALRSYLKVSPNRRENPAAGVRSLIGSLESALPDLAERHRDYIIEGSETWPVSCCSAPANSCAITFPLGDLLNKNH